MMTIMEKNMIVKLNFEEGFIIIIIDSIYYYYDRESSYNTHKSVYNTYLKKKWLAKRERFFG